LRRFTRKKDERALAEMRIATWNLERPKTLSQKNDLIRKKLEEIKADIWVLTETNDCICPGERYKPYPSEPDLLHSKGEKRVTIWSKYPVIEEHKTFCSSKSVCVTVRNGRGRLVVYGTVVGVYGNREKSFLPDLENQVKDWKRIGGEIPLCIAGDFNVSFSDNYYFTHEGRNKIPACFAELKIENLTYGIKDNIDHIAISKSFLRSAKPTSSEWNLDKKKAIPRLSDHIGVSVDVG
jgi:exonuclease III